MAAAVGAEVAFFSTCGSSLSVKAAMMAVAGGNGQPRDDGLVTPSGICAFFGRVQTVSTHKAAGRIAAEQITPFPPGIPAVVPGERLNGAVLEYLCSGARAGMNLPDAADASLQTIKVVG